MLSKRERGISSSQWDLIRQVLFVSWEMVEKGSSLDLEKIVLRSVWLVAVTVRARLLGTGAFPTVFPLQPDPCGFAWMQWEQELFYHIPDSRTAAQGISFGKYYTAVLAV